MAESWLRVSGAGAAEEAGLAGGLEESNTLNDSLTSLQWLQEFSILNAKAPALTSVDMDPHGYHELSGSAEPGSPLALDPACLGQPHMPGKPTYSCTLRSAPSGLQASPPDDVDYANNRHMKPSYSCATLICMAMQASKATKITLSAIYKWIMDSFCYFRHADPTWQNSIRHNLSLNKGFIKVPREKDEPGKGGFWRIDPQYTEWLLRGAFQTRGLPPVHIHPAFARQAVPEPSTAPWAGPMTMNTEAQQLLREFEEATGELGWSTGEGRLGHKRKQPLAKKVANVPWPSSPLLLTQEEQGELEHLKGNFDWEANFDTGTLDGELAMLETLELSPLLSPASHGDMDLTIQGHHIDCPVTWWPPVEQATDSLDFDETFLATSFLQHPWDESTHSSLPPEPLFEAGDATLPSDLHDSASLGAFL